MTKRMDWDRMRAEDRARKPAPAAEPAYRPRPKRAVPFAQVYAKYANRCRAKGEKPLPPIQWIESLKAK